MNESEHSSADAWERILPQIRATRRKRRHRKIAAATAICAILGIWTGMRFTVSSDNPVAPPIVTEVGEPSAPVTLAVMRVYQDGTVRLEEIACHELGPIELTLSLTPVIVSTFFE
jgi:anti-sigma-K factor RskA